MRGYIETLRMPEVITKAIIERHGGTIHVTSQPGQTTFTVLLPQSSAIGT